MAWNQAARPTGNCIGDSGMFKNVFYDNESVSWTLTAQGGGAYAPTTYQVRNFYGTIVASGSLSGSTLNLGVMPLGWYRLYFVRSTSLGNPFRFSGGEHNFVVVRSGGSLPARPAQSMLEFPSGGDPKFSSPAFVSRGITGFGPERHNVYLDDTWYTASQASVEIRADYQALKAASDSARPLKQVVCFPEGFVGGATPNATDNSRVTATVQNAITNTDVRWFEGRNEPNTNTTAANFYPELQAFANLVHAASGSALVAGPCGLTVGPQFPTESGRMFYENLFALGMGSYIDVVSFHNYGGEVGDIPSARRAFDLWVETLTKWGQQNKPRIDTEAGSQFMAVYGSYEPRLQAQNVMLDLHFHEQYGVPKEQYVYFYDTQHGFWDFPSWWIDAEGESNPGPLMALVRVWSEELFGKNYAARLDFGTIENDHWLGSRFDHPSNGTKVVVLQSGGRAGQVSLAVTGAASLTAVSPWGATSVLTVAGGKVTLDLDTLPVYVRLPSGATAVPAAVSYGQELARALYPRSVATSSATGPAAPLGSYDAARAVDGSIGRQLSVTVFDEAGGHWWDPLYLAGEYETPPGWWRLDFPRTTRFDTVVVTCPPPWQLMSSLIDFEIQVYSGAWTTVAHITEPTTTFQWSSYKAGGACFTDSFYSRRNVWKIDLATPAEGTAMRIYAIDTTYGGGATVDTTNGAGIPGAETGQTAPRRLCLREVQVYLREGVDGVVPGHPMLARPPS